MKNEPGSISGLVRQSISMVIVIRLPGAAHGTPAALRAATPFRRCANIHLITSGSL
jgi:hypothetical protein